MTLNFWSSCFRLSARITDADSAVNAVLGASPMALRMVGKHPANSQDNEVYADWRGERREENFLVHNCENYL